MSRRARKHIALREIAAAALSQLLPRAERDALREAKVPAQQVISMFTPDHVHLHAFGGVDLWHNLTMTRRGPELKAKDANDTRIAAKSKRLIKEQARHKIAMLARVPTGTEMDDIFERRATPKRRIPTRVDPWPKGRKLQSRSSFERRGER